MQNNDPKHTSRLAKSFAENGVNWWHTPPESPDANSIENLWHELKVSKINKLNPLPTIHAMRKRTHVTVRFPRARVPEGVLASGRYIWRSQELLYGQVGTKRELH